MRRKQRGASYSSEPDASGVVTVQGLSVHMRASTVRIEVVIML